MRYAVLLAHLWKNIGENIGCNLTKYRRNIGENYTSRVWSLVSHVIITLIPYIISHGFIWPNISQHSTQASSRKKMSGQKNCEKIRTLFRTSLVIKTCIQQDKRGQKCKINKNADRRQSVDKLGQVLPSQVRSFLSKTGVRVYHP